MLHIWFNECGIVYFCGKKKYNRLTDWYDWRHTGVRARLAHKQLASGKKKRIYNGVDVLLNNYKHFDSPTSINHVHFKYALTVSCRRLFNYWIIRSIFIFFCAIFWYEFLFYLIVHGLTKLGSNGFLFFFLCLEEFWLKSIDEENVTCLQLQTADLNIRFWFPCTNIKVQIPDCAFKYNFISRLNIPLNK